MTPPDDARYQELVDLAARLFPEPEEALTALSMTLAALLHTHRKTPTEAVEYLLRITAQLDARYDAETAATSANAGAPPPP